MFLLLTFIFSSVFYSVYGSEKQNMQKRKEIPIIGTTGVPVFRSINYSPVQVSINDEFLRIDFRESIGNMAIEIVKIETNEIVISKTYDTQLSSSVVILIGDIGDYQISLNSVEYEGRGEFSFDYE